MDEHNNSAPIFSDIFDSYKKLFKKFNDKCDTYLPSEPVDDPVYNPYLRFQVISKIFPNGEVYDQREESPTLIAERDACNYMGSGNLVSVKKHVKSSKYTKENFRKVSEFLSQLSLENKLVNNENISEIIKKISTKIINAPSLHKKNFSQGIDTQSKEEIQEFAMVYINYLNNNKPNP